MARASRTAAVVLVAAALILGGCGAAGRPSATQRPSAPKPSAPPNPLPLHHPRPADAGTVAVIRHWADALRRGDVRRAASFFEIPSVFAPAPDQEVTLHSLADAEAVNTGLPCGARLISVMRIGGPLVQALFRLTGRPGPGGTTCDPGAGQTARTNFVIASGRIRVWLRAPDEPGDNQPPPPGSGKAGPTI